MENKSSVNVEATILKASIREITSRYGLDKEEVKGIIKDTSLEIKKNLYAMERGKI